jgi:hypothetical protein
MSRAVVLLFGFCCVALLYVRIAIRLKPHPSYPFSCEKGRCCIANPRPYRHGRANCITTTSSLCPYLTGLIPLIPSPVEKGRCCISLIIFITTTSASVLCSAYSERLIAIILFEKRGLCADGLLRQEKVGMRRYARPR